MKENMSLIYEMMPTGWKEAVKETGALVRSRNISTPEELLRLNFLYQTSGDSYGLTSALTQISENQTGLNKTAVQKRITNSGKWLKWILLQLCQEEKYLTESPEWLKGYRVCLTDASNYSKQGSKNADFRLHHMVELFTLNIVEFHFTEASEGEKISRYETIQSKDIIVADRAYGTIKGMEYVINKEADFLFRLKAKSFNLYTENKELFDLTSYLQDSYEAGKIIDLHLFYKSEKSYHPVRICAVGKDDKNIEKSNNYTKKSNSKEKRGKITDLQKIYNQYVLVSTSLPETISAEQILELYRMRWQIELVFKRLKSIFGGEFCAKKKEAVEAWFYGKLLLAVVCEILVKRGRFSPHTMKEILIDDYRLSFWKELQVMLYLFAHVIADSFSFTLNTKIITNLSVHCANSKRKRIPMLFRFANAA